MNVRDELIRMWNEAPWPIVNNYPDIALRKVTINLNQDRLSPSWDSKRNFPNTKQQYQPLNRDLQPKSAVYLHLIRRPIISGALPPRPHAINCYGDGKEANFPLFMSRVGVWNWLYFASTPLRRLRGAVFGHRGYFACNTRRGIVCRRRGRHSGRVCGEARSSESIELRALWSRTNFPRYETPPKRRTP
jgi:hypothetical protein